MSTIFRPRRAGAVAALAFALPLLLVACGDDNDADSVDIPGGGTVEVTEQDREQFQQEARDRLQDAERELDELRDKVPEGSASDEIQRGIDELENGLDSLKERVDELENADDAEFEQMRDDAEKALDDFVDMLERFRAQFED